MVTLWLIACRAPVPVFTDDTVDADGDGFAKFEDCDDTDAAVNPDAMEVTGDGIDNDCDRAIDCDDRDLKIGAYTDPMIWENQVATFCDGYCALQVYTNLYLDSPAIALDALAGLACVTVVHGIVRIGQPFADLAGLGALSHADTLLIAGVLSVAGLDSLTTVGTLHIDKTETQDLSGLGNLASITGDLEITSNMALTDVSALHGLTEVGGDVYIVGNFELGDAAGHALVEAIDHIEGLVTVTAN